MTVNIATAKDLCKAYMAANIPAFMIGPPGVGKSETWKQIADEAGIGLIDLRLAQMDPVDLRGLPVHHDGLTKWARPDFWPDEKRDGKRGIILFDEMSDISRAMQSAAYQIILDGRAGPHELPKGWYRAAAGNRREDRAAAQAISTALASRFGWVEVTADPDTFVQYGNVQGFHEYVLGYIRFRPSHIHSMEGADLRAFPCPRQWEKVSRVLNTDPPQNLRFNLLKGLVGEGAASEFEAFIKALDLPDLEDILKDPKKCHIPKEPGTKYALTSMLARNATRQNFDKIVAYISRNEYGREFEICTVIDATKRDATLCETRAFVDFTTRNQELHL